MKNLKIFNFFAKKYQLSIYNYKILDLGVNLTNIFLYFFLLKINKIYELEKIKKFQTYYFVKNIAIFFLNVFFLRLDILENNNHNHIDILENNNHNHKKKLTFWHFLKKIKIKTLVDVGSYHSKTFIEFLQNDIELKNYIAFEPIKENIEIAKENIETQIKLKDFKYEVNNIAISNTAGNKIFNVSKNFQSSSLLEIKKKHTDVESSSEVFKKIEVEARRLKDFEIKYSSLDNIFLKIDTQGSELDVLKSLEDDISKISLIQLEISYVELYEKSSNWLDVLTYMENNNFKVIDVKRVFFDEENYQLLQSDFIFINTLLHKEYI